MGAEMLHSNQPPGGDAGLGPHVGGTRQLLG